MYEILRMAHLIMIAMATGMSVSHYILLRASSGVEGESGRALAFARRTLGDFTTMVIAFVWVTGLMLLWGQYGDPAREVSAWFYAKLVFVGLMTAAHVMQRIAARRVAADQAEGRRVIERWVSVVWLSALVAICLAVVSFSR
ncbi:MAG: hypothetical protein ACRED5_06130 [Propylenella sp.]